MSGPTYLFAIEDKPVLDLFEIPLIKATEESIREYGCLVDHPGDYEIEIVQWPAQGGASWMKIPVMREVESRRCFIGTGKVMSFTAQTTQ